MILVLALVGALPPMAAKQRVGLLSNRGARAYPLDSHHSPASRTDLNRALFVNIAGRHNKRWRLLTMRAGVLLLTMLMCSTGSPAYSVLTHEEIVDLVWASDIRPLLAQSIINTTVDQYRAFGKRFAPTPACSRIATLTAGMSGSPCSMNPTSSLFAKCQP